MRKRAILCCRTLHKRWILGGLLQILLMIVKKETKCLTSIWVLSSSTAKCYSTCRPDPIQPIRQVENIRPRKNQLLMTRHLFFRACPSIITASNSWMSPTHKWLNWETPCKDLSRRSPISDTNNWTRLIRKQRIGWSTSFRTRNFTSSLTYIEITKWTTIYKSCKLSINSNKRRIWKTWSWKDWWWLSFRGLLSKSQASFPKTSYILPVRNLTMTKTKRRWKRRTNGSIKVLQAPRGKRPGHPLKTSKSKLLVAAKKIERAPSERNLSGSRSFRPCCSVAYWRSRQVLPKLKLRQVEGFEHRQGRQNDKQTKTCPRIQSTKLWRALRIRRVEKWWVSKSTVPHA